MSGGQMSLFGDDGEAPAPTPAGPLEVAVPPAARPVPARITMALDIRELYGPEVDVACGTWEGNPAGDVDAWEAGTATPDAAQVARLSELTGYPVAFFYEPPDAGDRVPSRVFICDRSKRRHGLTVVTSWVDSAGVLHREYETPAQDKSGGGRG